MLEIAKLIHEAIGIESPKRFIFVCALVGAILFASIGWLIDRGYRVKLKEEAKSNSMQVPQINGPATAGNGSIANTGNGNTINQSPPPEKPLKKE
jgi:hypothetical protein